MSNHHHGHHHGHQDSASMSVSEKIKKLLDHWIKHNEDHADTYRLWAGRAREEGLLEVADILEAAAGSNTGLNEQLGKALEKLEG